MKNLILLFSIVLMTVNCSGNALVDASSLSPNANFDLTDLGEISVYAVHHPKANADGTYSDKNHGDHLAFTSSTGFDIEVTKAQIYWNELTLSASTSGDENCQEELSVNLNLQTSESLLDEDLTTTLIGEDSIPKIEYCAYEISIGQEDPSSTVNLLAAEDHEHADDESDLMDESILFEGTWTKDDQSGNFSVHLDELITISGLFKAKEDGEIIVHPLHFHDEESVSVIFGLNYDKLFDDIDFQNNSHETIMAKLKDNLTQQIHQHLGEHHSATDNEEDMHDHP